MPPLISLRDVSRIFRAGRETITAVDQVSFDVLPGEFLILTGPSGSGKSVLLNLLALLDSPSSGVFRFSGQDMRARADDEITCLRNRKIGMIFQRPWMIDRLSVADNVALPLRHRGIDIRKSAREACAWLERVGLL
ncbi:MAG: ATP-binding cassette domain-containing protein, partial [Opitutaceae bacterium]